MDQVVRLHRIVLENFKSFHGIVEVNMTPDQCDFNRGILTCVVGPNGSGKSTIADALLFCFGEKDDRSSLKNLVNDYSRKRTSKTHPGEGRTTERPDDETLRASVTAEFRLNENSIVKVKRSVLIVKSSGKVRSEFHFQIGSDKQFELITRSALILRLQHTLGINLEVVESFICKQQGSTVVRFSGSDLLNFIEKLVGTSKLAKEIEEQMHAFEKFTDEAIKIEAETVLVSSQRKDLAPQRMAFERYRKEQGEFCTELVSFSNKETLLCEHQFENANTKLQQINGEVKDLSDKSNTAERFLKQANSSIESINRKITKLRSIEQSEVKTLVSLEELNSSASMELKKAKRKFEAASKAKKGNKHLSEATEKLETCKLTSEVAAMQLNQAKESILDINIQGISMQLNNSEASKQRIFLKQLMEELQEIQQSKKEVDKSHKEQGILLQKLSSETKGLEVKLKAASRAFKESENHFTSSTSKVCVAKELVRQKEKEESKAQATLEESILVVSRANIEVNQLQIESRVDKTCHFVSNNKKTTRERFAQLLNELHHQFEEINKNNQSSSSRIHGWINELAWCREHFQIAVNSVLKSALSNVLVVESRRDAIKIVNSARENKLGLISCDVLDELRQQKIQTIDENDGGDVKSKLIHIVENGGLVPMMSCIELVSPEFVSVFASRLHNWRVCATEGNAIEHQKHQPRTNIVTLDGVMFLADGELRSHDPCCSRNTTKETELLITRAQGGDVLVPPKTWLKSLCSTQNNNPAKKQGEFMSSSMLLRERTIKEALQTALNTLATAEENEKSSLEELSRIDQERKSAEVAHRQAVIDLNKQKLLHTQRLQHLDKLKEEENIQIEKMSGKKKLINSIEEKLSTMTSQISDINKRIDQATQHLGDVDSEWLFRDNEFQKQKNDAAEKLAQAQQISRSADVALRAAERGYSKAKKKILDLESNYQTTEKQLENSLKKQEQSTTKMNHQKEKVVRAGSKLPSLLTTLDELQAQKLKYLADSNQWSSALKIAAKRASSAKMELDALNEWKKAIGVRNHQIKHQLSSLNLKLDDEGRLVNEHDQPLDTTLSDIDNSCDEIDEIKNQDTLNKKKTNASDDEKKENKRSLNRRCIIDQSSSSDDEDSMVCSRSEQCSKIRDETSNTPKKKWNKKNDSIKSGPSLRGKTEFTSERTNDKSSKIITNVEQCEEELSVQRAVLKLRQLELQTAEDNVDIGAIEKDLYLASEEDKLLKNSKQARQTASDALHRKQIIEQERFDRLFGSLEQINAAFADSYSSLSRDGEGDLRYSREPLTLFKEGVSIYAKPSRSPWRLAQSLSGGQQATIGLALLFAFQFVYKSPFYLLDEVDASLDAQHAASAGYLMQQRAANENVQYIAISHRPQLFIHADRMVGTYGVPDTGSLCVAMDFPRFDGVN